MSYGEMKAAAQAIEKELESLGFTTDECITILGAAVSHFIGRHAQPHEVATQFASNLLAITVVTNREPADAETKH